MEKKRRSKFSVIDLFSGAGGLSKGFSASGFDVLLGVDNDKAPLSTFELNHNGAKALSLDMSDKKVFKDIENIIGNRELDVIVAGPPCQGFSLSGPRNFDDERNKLYLAVIKIVKTFKPKEFIIENMPEMAKLYNGEIKNKILKRFKKRGYNISCKILCAADYGVPQMRRRLIFMGVRKDVGESHFPDLIYDEKNYITN